MEYPNVIDIEITPKDYENSGKTFDPDHCPLFIAIKRIFGIKNVKVGVNSFQVDNISYFMNDAFTESEFKNLSNGGPAFKTIARR